MEIEIKDEFKGTEVGFNGSGLPLGERDDLAELALLAQQSRDPSLLKLFAKIPSLAELQKTKTDEQLQKIKPAAKPVLMPEATPKNFTGTDVRELNRSTPSA